MYLAQSSRPQLDAARAAAEAAIPAHLQLVWEERTGGSYADTAATRPTYTARGTGGTTYDQTSARIPGT